MKLVSLLEIGETDGIKKPLFSIKNISPFLPTRNKLEKYKLFPKRTAEFQNSRLRTFYLKDHLNVEKLDPKFGLKGCLVGECLCK